jgi:hypothetical protein
MQETSSSRGNEAQASCVSPPASPRDKVSLLTSAATRGWPDCASLFLYSRLRHPRERAQR